MVSSRFFWFCARRLEEEDAGQYPLRIVGSVVRGTATRGHALGVSDPYFIRRSSRRAAPGAGPARALLFCRAAGRRSCRWYCPREWCASLGPALGTPMAFVAVARGRLHSVSAATQDDSPIQRRQAWRTTHTAAADRTIHTPLRVRLLWRGGARRRSVHTRSFMNCQLVNSA